jgi:glycosyltransferase involved in cell wall biosynthesis
LNNKEFVDLFYKSKWGLKYLLFYFVELIIIKNRPFQIQYPTEGYGYSLLLFSMASKINKFSFSNLPCSKRTTDIAYFGHIRPNKGVENYVNAISILNGNLNIQLTLKVLGKYCTFLKV